MDFWIFGFLDFWILDFWIFGFLDTLDILDILDFVDFSLRIFGFSRRDTIIIYDAFTHCV